MTKILRKLAREFVVFGLVAGFIGGAIGFVIAYRELTPTPVDPTALKQFLTNDPLAKFGVPAYPILAYSIEWCHDVPNLPTNSCLAQLALLEEPILAEAQIAFNRTQIIPPSDSKWENTGVYLVAVGWGFAFGALAGFGSWFFYRTIRFAVKG